MGILNEIASGSMGGALQGLQLGQAIQERQRQNQMAEVQTGMALQRMQEQQRAITQEQLGRETVGRYLQPPGGRPMEQAAAPAAQQPMEAGEPGQLTPEQGAQMVRVINETPTAKLDEAGNYQQLADALAAQGNVKMATPFYAAAAKAQQKMAAQTKEQRAQAEALFDMVGQPFKHVAQLEEQGDTEQAKSVYQDVMDRVATDPRFAENEEIQKLLQHFADYKPGMGKYLYVSTAYGKNTRDKFDKEQAKQSKFNSVNLYWEGLDNPVAARFNPGQGDYEYLTPQGWKTAPADARLMPTSITGTKAEVTGLTKPNIGEINSRMGKNLEARRMLEKLAPLVEKTPSATGLRGKASEFLAGWVGQLGDAGVEAAKLIQSEDEGEIRKGIQYAAGQLIPTITGDTSGRYSNFDKQQVDKFIGLDIGQNPAQLKTAITTLTEALKNGELRDQFALKNNRYPTFAEFEKMSGKKLSAEERKQSKPEGQGNYSHLWSK